MKIIIVSDALDEPYEIESPKKENPMWIYGVRDQIEAVLRTERMKANADRHGIFGR